MPILGHGIDIVAIERIERMLSDHGDHFAERCFSPVERAYCDEALKVRGERYAARFAAKEAVLKALGTGLRYGIGFEEIQVHRSAEGAPCVFLEGKAASVALSQGIEHWHLSLSHAGGFAIASVVAEGIDGASLSSSTHVPDGE